MALLQDEDNSACHKATLPCSRYPEENIWCLNINTHYLYQLVKEGNCKYDDPRNAEYVVKQLLNDHKIPHELVDLNAASNLLISKIKYMFNQLRKARFQGGNSRRLLFRRWTGHTYRLKIGNLKHKFEFHIQRKNQDGSWFVNVNTHSLFNLVQEGNLNYYDPRNAERVLKQILTDHNIPHELVDVNARAKPLLSKIQYMFRQFRKRKFQGGNSRKLLLHRWTGETYRLKIGDSTGRFESDLEDQRKRRKIEEEKFVKCQWSTLVQMERQAAADGGNDNEDTSVFGGFQVKMEQQEDDDYDDDATMIPGGVQVKIEHQDDDEYDEGAIPGGVQVKIEQQEDEDNDYGDDEDEDATVIPGGVQVRIEQQDDYEDDVDNAAMIPGGVKVKIEPEDEDDIEDATMIPGGVQVKIEQQDGIGGDHAKDATFIPGGVHVKIEQQEDDGEDDTTIMDDGVQVKMERQEDGGEHDAEDVTMIDVTIKIEPMDEVSDENQDVEAGLKVETARANELEVSHVWTEHDEECSLLDSRTTTDHHRVHVGCLKVETAQPSELEVSQEDTRTVHKECSLLNRTDGSLTATDHHGVHDGCEETSRESYHEDRHTGFGEKLKTYHCDFCGKPYANSCQLKQHVTIHTQKEMYKLTCEVKKTYLCDICDEAFTDAHSLKRQKMIITGEKPYQCDICNKRFTQEIHLKTHRVIQTGEKPYQCGVCDKRFMRQTHLKIHKMTHTGERPYQCDVCNKRFTHETTFKRHKVTHTGEKPYQCDVCDKCFTRAYSLKYHKRTHTGERPHECDHHICY